MTRSDIANVVRVVARGAPDSTEWHWRAVRKITAYLNTTKNLGLVFVKGGDVVFSVYIGADDADKDIDRCSVLRVAMIIRLCYALN